MSRSYGGNVNASLIREGRLILQQLFRHKEHTQFWAPKSTQSVVPALKCLRCVAGKKSGSRPKKVNDAITMFNGTALCEDHV